MPVPVPAYISTSTLPKLAGKKFPFIAVLLIRDVYPGSRILIFTHPGSRIQKQQQKKGAKKIGCQNFTNFTKLQLFYFFNAEKKNWSNFQKILELFTQKIVTTLSKIWVWDPGSGKNLFGIPCPGGQKGTGSRIRIRNTALLIQKKQTQVLLS